jgi:hypothetical protein
VRTKSEQDWMLLKADSDMNILKFFAIFPFGFLLLAGCSGMNNTQTKASRASVYDETLKTTSGEPAYVTVQHCLISFRGTPTSATRTMSEAEQLATELFEKAQAGEDFDAMIRQYTDDSPPGIYRMANDGFAADMDSREPVYSRRGMVSAFGDTGFPLEVGEFGLAAFDPVKSPFGWHIVKRIK